MLHTAADTRPTRIIILQSIAAPAGPRPAYSRRPIMPESRNRIDLIMARTPNGLMAQGAELMSNAAKASASFPISMDKSSRRLGRLTKLHVLRQCYERNTYVERTDCLRKHLPEASEPSRNREIMTCPASGTQPMSLPNINASDPSRPASAHDRQRFHPHAIWFRHVSSGETSCQTFWPRRTRYEEDQNSSLAKNVAPPRPFSFEPPKRLSLHRLDIAEPL